MYGWHTLASMGFKKKLRSHKVGGHGKGGESGKIWEVNMLKIHYMKVQSDEIF